MKNLTESDLLVLRGYANNNMNALQTAHNIFFSKRVVYYHLNAIKHKTGKDPRNFWELLELLEMYKERKID